MLGRTFRTPSLEERLTRDPTKPASAPLWVPSRQGATAGLPLGAILYLVSIGFVAAVTVGVFFGLGFHLLAHHSAAGVYSAAQSASAEATSIPGDAARSRVAAAATTALPLMQKAGGEQGQRPIAAASGAPALVGKASSGIPDRPIGSASGSAAAALGRAVPPDASVPQPAAELSAAPPALPQATSPHPLAAEIAALLAHGNAAFRKGDIAAARLFYQHAFEAGEGRGAMGMGATYDPAFLRLSPLRILYGDPAEARAWYLHALALGAAGAERRLIKLQARAAR